MYICNEFFSERHWKYSEHLSMASRAAPRGWGASAQGGGVSWSWADASWLRKSTARSRDPWGWQQPEHLGRTSWPGSQTVAPMKWWESAGFQFVPRSTECFGWHLDSISPSCLNGTKRRAVWVTPAYAVCQAQSQLVTKSGLTWWVWRWQGSACTAGCRVFSCAILGGGCRRPPVTPTCSHLL